MLQDFRILSKSDEGSNGIECSGEAKDDAINVSYVNRKAKMVKEVVDPNGSLQKRIVANTKSEFSKYLLLCLTPRATCNVVEFCTKMYAANYFNLHPDEGLLAATLYVFSHDKMTCSVINY